MNISENKRALINAAKKIIKNDIDVVSRIREISELSAGMEERDAYPLLFFRAIESETDSFPMITADNEDLYDKKFAERKSEELNEYLRSVEKEILDAAKAIIERFS